MSISINTYSNPYRLRSEKIWGFIHHSFQLCGSQTLVNGLCDYYHDDGYYVGQLTTMRIFINHLYEGWLDARSLITQQAVIDNLLDTMDFEELTDLKMSNEEIRSSLKKNRSSICEAIRIMFEMDMNPDNIKLSSLTDEQKIVVKLYKRIYERDEKSFHLRNKITEQELNDAIAAAIRYAYEHSHSSEKHDLTAINTDVVVIHGIHQFTPIMLRAIECLSKYKTVMIIFQYQPDYKNVYETWLDLETESSEAIGRLTVNVNLLNVRDIPDVSGNKVGKTWENCSYLYYDVRQNSEYTWYRIGYDMWIADNGSWITK